MRQAPLELELRVGFDDVETGGFQRQTQHLAQVVVIVNHDDAAVRFGMEGVLGVHTVDCGRTALNGSPRLPAEAGPPGG